MKDGYTWSGGPLDADSVEQGRRRDLVPNPKYWGQQPLVDKVEMKFFADTAAEFQAFKAGEVDAIGPQPQLDAIDQINAGLPGVTSKVHVEHGQRRGAVDQQREGTVRRRGRPPGLRLRHRPRRHRQASCSAASASSKAVNSLNPPITAAYSEPGGVGRLQAGPRQGRRRLMTGAGYAKGSDGIWAKGGQKVSFTIQSTAGNKRRELTEQILQQQLKDAGFEMTIQNQKAERPVRPASCRRATSSSSLYAQTATTLNPGLSSTQLSTNIPTAANNNTGSELDADQRPGGRPAPDDGRHQPGRRRTRQRRQGGRRPDGRRIRSPCPSTRCPTSGSTGRRSRVTSASTSSRGRGGTSNTWSLAS